MSVCKGCGAEVQWIITPNGKRVPLEPKKTLIWTQVRSKPTSLCTSPPPLVWKLVSGYESHFAHCPQAKEFRKKEDS